MRISGRLECDHVERLARQYSLSDHDRYAIEAHWLARVDTELAELIERLRYECLSWPQNRPRLERHCLVHPSDSEGYSGDSRTACGTRGNETVVVAGQGDVAHVTELKGSILLLYPGALVHPSSKTPKMDGPERGLGLVLFYPTYSAPAQAAQRPK
jgi:hypothetical protein